MLPESLHNHLVSAEGIEIARTRPVSGGDINHAAILESRDGRKLFIKYNKSPQAAAMFRSEMLGLRALGTPGAIAVPEAISQGEAPEGWAWLILEYIVPGHRSRAFWEDFGRSLATLHGNTSPQFGFGHDNFIGSLPQSNAGHETWSEFYEEERLRPQMRTALAKKQLDSADERRLEALCARLDSLCPAEPPALIHGDLWGGNFLCNEQAKPVLIDPAACYAHREMDLAMSRLFGGFDPLFYQSYEEARPLIPGFSEREEIYQLYYLLVHVNLFGGGYVGQVRSILGRFG
jgi:protein-ribulosamine 3-kinase